MAEKVCPHCNHPVPPEFAVMPVCMMCGGDINAQPTHVWSAVDIQGGGSLTCPACHTEVKSVLVTECPQCGAAMVPGVAEPAAASLDSHLDTMLEEPVVAVPEPVPAATPEPVVAAPEPVAPSKPEPVSLPSFVSEPIPATRPEPKPEPKPTAAKKEGFFDKLLRMLGLKK